MANARHRRVTCLVKLSGQLGKQSVYLAVSRQEQACFPPLPFPRLGTSCAYDLFSLFAPLAALRGLLELRAPIRVGLGPAKQWSPDGVSRPEFPIHVDVKVQWATGRVFGSASHPAQASYRSAVLSQHRPCSGTSRVEPWFSKRRCSESAGVARGAPSPSGAGAQGGRRGSGLRPPGDAPSPGRVAVGGGSSGWPLGVLAAKARGPSAHLAGLNARMLTERTRTLSRGPCWGTFPRPGAETQGPTAGPVGLQASERERENRAR